MWRIVAWRPFVLGQKGNFMPVDDICLDVHIFFEDAPTILEPVKHTTNFKQVSWPELQTNNSFSMEESG